MKRVAPLCYDVIFKKAFCDRDIFTAFVHDALGITIEIDKVETEKTFKPSIGRVASRYDLFAQDLKNRVIVDIQHVRHDDHYNAFLHYHCAAILEQAVTAKNYNPALTVYSLVVLTSGDKHKKDVLVIDFDPKDRQGKGVSEIRHKVFYVCPKYVDEATPAPLREWLQAIDDTLDEQVEESNYHQQQLKEEGYKAGQLAVVRSMLTKGMAVDLIAELSGLSLDEVENAARQRFESPDRI